MQEADEELPKSKEAATNRKTTKKKAVSNPNPKSKALHEEAKPSYICKVS